MKPCMRLAGLRPHIVRTMRPPPLLVGLGSHGRSSALHQKRASGSVPAASTAFALSSSAESATSIAIEDHRLDFQGLDSGGESLPEVDKVENTTPAPQSPQNASETFEQDSSSSSPANPRQFLAQVSSEITALSSLRYGDALIMTPQVAMHTLLRYLKLREALNKLATHRIIDLRLVGKLWSPRLRVQRVMLELLCARALHEVRAVSDNCATAGIENGGSDSGAASGALCRALHRPLDLLRRPWPRHLQHRQYELKDAIRVAILQILALHHRNNRNQRNPLVSAVDARGLLSRASRVFVREARVICPLAALAAADFSDQSAASCATPRDVVQVMRAVGRAGVHAPDTFWRTALVHLLSNLSAVYRPLQQKDGIGVGSGEAEDFPVVGLVYSALQTLKRERWSGDLFLLHELAGVALRTLSRRLGRSTASSTNSVAVASDDVAASGEAQPSQPSRDKAAPLSTSSLSRQSVIRSVSKTADGLTPEQLLRLAVIACEVGHAKDPLLRSLLIPLLVPVARTRRSPSDFQLILQLLDLGRRNVQCVPLYQAVIDALVATNSLHNNGSSPSSSSSSSPSATPVYGETRKLVPATRAVTIAVATDLVRHPEFLPSLDLSRFVHLLLLTAREKKKMSPTNLVVLTNVLYQFHRSVLDHQSSVSVHIRRAVDEFAYQIHKMLKHNVVSVGLVNHFLEYRILLGMTATPQRGGDHRQESSPDCQVAVGQHMADLKRTRDALFAATDASGEEFFGVQVRRYHHDNNCGDGRGVVTVTALSEAHGALEERVAPVYQALFSLTQSVYVRRSKPRERELEDLERRAFEGGLYGTFKAVDVYYALHRERATSLETPTQMLPSAVVRALAVAVRQRLVTCFSSSGGGGGVAKPGMAQANAPFASAQVATALGMPHDAPMEPTIVADLRSALERRSALYVELESDPFFLRWVQWVRDWV